MSYSCKEIMSELDSMGTAQNRKIYQRHGVSTSLFGVSFANLKLMKKKIKTDHTLAKELWETGNFDARNLAVMIADPQTTTSEELDTWVNNVTNYCSAEALVGNLVTKTPYVKEKMFKWKDSGNDLVGESGWAIVAHNAMKDESIDDSLFIEFLNEIEATIHSRSNRTRYAMNMALIAIGIRNGILQKRAFEVAEKIGKVEVDHGQTSCKTPDAREYMERTLALRAKKEMKK